MSDLPVGTFVVWAKPTRRPPGYIVAENGCHVWTGARTPEGYGNAWDGTKVGRVHRIRYEREVGPIPPGMELDHVCGNRACCNPAHVRPASHRENTLRSNGVASAAAAKTHCAKGHPLSGDNLAPWRLRRGLRQCLLCARQSSKDAGRRRRQGRGTK